MDSKEWKEKVDTLFNRMEYNFKQNSPAGYLNTELV